MYIYIYIYRERCMNSNECDVTQLLFISSNQSDPRCWTQNDWFVYFHTANHLHVMHRWVWWPILQMLSDIESIPSLFLILITICSTYFDETAVKNMLINRSNQIWSLSLEHLIQYSLLQSSFTKIIRKITESMMQSYERSSISAGKQLYRRWQCHYSDQINTIQC